MEDPKKLFETSFIEVDNITLNSNDFCINFILSSYSVEYKVGFIKLSLVNNEGFITVLG